MLEEDIRAGSCGFNRDLARFGRNFDPGEFHPDGYGLYGSWIFCGNFRNDLR
jgi:hypothetical protein